MLWQVWIGNNDKELSNLNSDAKSKNIKNLEGIIGDYWSGQPRKEFTHVIVYSPYLNILRKLDSLTIPSQALNPANISLQQLYNEQYIKQENILCYNRTNVEFTHKCKIKDIYNVKKLSVILTSADNIR
ncbi:3957_t:CDS:2, partial [Funneliformis mosseae]